MKKIKPIEFDGCLTWNILQVTPKELVFIDCDKLAGGNAPDDTLTDESILLKKIVLPKGFSLVAGRKVKLFFKIDIRRMSKLIVVKAEYYST